MTTPDSSLREATAHRVRTVIATRGTVRELNMFGCLAFMVDEKMAVAADRGGGLLVRTDPAEYASLRRRGAKVAYMSADRPMGEGWLTVPRPAIEGDAELAFWIEVGIRATRVAA